MAGEKTAGSYGNGGSSGDENRGNRGIVSLRRVADGILFRGEVGIAVSPIESVDVSAVVANEFEFVLSKPPVVCVFSSIFDS